MRKRLPAISLLGLVAVCSASAQTPLAPSYPASPDEASAATRQAEDERRATEKLRQIKKRRGFRHEVPSPRA